MQSSECQSSWYTGLRSFFVQQEGWDAVVVKHLDEWDVQPVILIAQRGEKCSAGFNTNYPLDMRRRQVILGRSLMVDLLRAEGVEGELNEELWF